MTPRSEGTGGSPLTPPRRGATTTAAPRPPRPCVSARVIIPLLFPLFSAPRTAGRHHLIPDCLLALCANRKARSSSRYPIRTKNFAPFAPSRFHFPNRQAARNALFLILYRRPFHLRHPKIFAHRPLIPDCLSGSLCES
jgi:hypothetical protein